MYHFHISDQRVQTVYMFLAKYTGPSGWTREYYGYLMAKNHSNSPSQFTCIDKIFKSVIGMASSRNGMRFSFVEGRCGSLFVLHMVTPGNGPVQFVPSNMTVQSSEAVAFHHTGSFI